MPQKWLSGYQGLFYRYRGQAAAGGFVGLREADHDPVHIGKEMVGIR